MEDADAGTMTFGAATLRDRAETDEAILEELYDRYAHALYRYALALVSSAEDAEDAVQEVFVRIARKRFTKIDNIKAYLYTAARNSAYSILRSRRRRNETGDEALFDLSDDTSLPIEAFALRECFARLPIEQREILVLKIYDELTFEEIAQTIGISINTAASRYRYGIDRLKRALEES